METNPRSLAGQASRPMLSGLIIGPALVLLALAMPSPASAASSVTIYQAALDTPGQRSDVTRFDGRANCKTGSSKTTITTKVGKRTSECAYRVPAAGKSVELTATGRLSTSTPKSIRARTFLALSLRHAANGSRYQLAVFPRSTRVQIRKIEPNGKVKVLAGKNLGPKRVSPVGKSNRMTFGAYNGVPGRPASSARLFARVNGKKALSVNDPAGNELSGTGISFSVGSSKNARNAAGAFSKLVVRMPNPYR